MESETSELKIDLSQNLFKDTESKRVMTKFPLISQ